MHYPVRVLFVGSRGSSRSQIAEALLRRMGKGDFQIYSAGIDPEGLDPLAMEVMGEIGIDISGQMSKILDEFIGQDFDYVITLCDASRDCMLDFPGAHQCVCWRFPDPSQLKGNHAEWRRRLRHMCLEMAERIGAWVETQYQRLREEGVLLPSDRYAKAAN